MNGMGSLAGTLARGACLLAAFGNAAAVDLSEADCVIEPHLSVDLSTSVDGIVEEVLVDRGDVVRAGDVLVRLESGVEQAAVQQARLRTDQMAEVDLARERLLFARKKQTRTLQLYTDNAISEFTKDEVDLEVETALLEVKRAIEFRERAMLDLDRALEILKLRTILSPIDGVVVERLVAKGEAIGEQQTVLLKLVQIDPLNVELIVPASEFGSISLGMTVTVRPGFPVDGTVDARIIIIDPIIDASSGTFGVRATLPNPGFRIPAGLTCRVAMSDDPAGPQ
jgi:RND family efflux transporter MFP subunit